MKYSPSKYGFTLIELLTVIAIIGILAGILFPAIGKVRDVANKAKSAANMRSIAIAYTDYSTSGGRFRTLTASKMSADSDITHPGVAGVAQFLAKHAGLSEAPLWFIETDTLIANYTDAMPSIVGFRDENNVYKTSPEWKANAPVGYDFAIGISGNAPTSTTPLLWTRGLKVNGVGSGTWGKDSPWGLGGHIAFLDGHVKYFNEIGVEDGQLVNPSNGSLTSSMADIHPIVNILRAPIPRYSTTQNNSEDVDNPEDLD